MKVKNLTSRWLALALFLQLNHLASAQNGNGQEHWVATWAASPQQPRVIVPAAPQAPPTAQPNTAPPPIASFNNQTVRMTVHTSIGGRRVRVQLSNAFGAGPLTIGAAHIAIRGKDSAIVPASDRVLLFGGKPSCSIPPGALMVSDPVDLDVPKMGDLAISVHVPGESGPLTMHAVGLHNTYISKSGDFTAQPVISDPAATSQSWYWLSGVDVLASADTAAIVAFGDSITDGTRSTPEANHNWPSYLAQRIPNVAIIDEGIAGNRILRDTVGPSALARFDRDVLSQSGVKWMTVLEGINDIGNSTRLNTNIPASESVSADDLIVGQRQLIERAHSHGIKVIGCTLTPYEGAAYYSEKGEAIREAVNQWIRTGGAFDAVVDFDAATRNPDAPKQIRADYDSGDHLHPNDAGYKAMADSIDLSIFTPRTGSKTQ
jgi:lysophospholipase L1-like esterase